MSDHHEADTTEESANLNFIEEIIEEHNTSRRFDGQVKTRFPPEPNGYLHIGHAKAIALDFGLAAKYNGTCNLRFDDTNPSREEQEYVDAIQADLRWLGFQWDNLFYASDYFEQLYQYSLKLIKDGNAFVCDLTAEQMANYRGTLTEPGKESPYRNRSVDENLDLFIRMRNGEYPNGARTLRAKIDMAHPNITMRDPVMYRIMHVPHHRTADAWCIYPTYDWAHGQSDSIEGITHSICTLEFENHRPLYDWFCDNLDIHHPQQIEFARFNLTNTVMSKRKLLQLVKEGYVSGWDDPRMPTLCGMRRRGYTSEAILKFLKHIGVTKVESTIETALLEHFLREDLNKRSDRRLAVLDPLKVIITNYPEDKEEILEAVNNPEDESAGSRDVPFSRELYIDRDDFMEDPPKKYFRLAPGKEVRLRYGYYITCQEAIKDSDGTVVELHCTYDPETRGGWSPDGRKVKGTIHWVSAKHALPAEIRQYDTLLSEDKESDNWLDTLNDESLVVLPDCLVEASLKDAAAGKNYQFERKGYFVLDKDSTDEKLVFNRTVGLRDSWAKMQKKG